jgi:hypothetical protein
MSEGMLPNYCCFNAKSGIKPEASKSGIGEPLAKTIIRTPPLIFLDQQGSTSPVPLIRLNET